MKSRLPLATFCIVTALGFLGRAPGQTYDVNGQSSTSSGKQKQPTQSAPRQNGTDFSWGAGIDVAREARAAQDALKRGDYAAGVSYAQQAAKSASQNAELWFLLGYAARLAERYPLSVDSYNHGLQLQPSSVRGLAGLAQTYVKMGRDQDAEELLRRVVDANPKDAGSLQLSGELLLNTDPKRSLELLERADALQPSAHNDLLIAHAYQRLGQAEESAKYLNRAKSRAPHDSDVLRAVAGQYRDQGKYDQAIAALQGHPSKSADVMAELAYTYQLAGRQQEAATLYSRLAKSAKGNIALELSAAQAWINVGQPDAARPFLEAARQIDGNNYRLHAILATIAESEERLSDAATEYQLALNNLPARVPEGPLYPIELRLNLYELDTRQDDATAAKLQLDAAAAAMHQLQITGASRPEMLRLRAAIEAASGDLDAANRHLKEALSLAPSNVNSLMNYGTLLWKLGQKDAARETFAKVLELDRNNRQALSSLGYLARDAGNSKLAETYFSRAAAAHPKDFAPYLALGDLYTAERNFRSAETNYENAYQRMPENALVIAGGANAALESHHINLAEHWLQRATDKTNASPQVKRERERYLTFKGDYAESAQLGYEVIEKLPNDREGAVYLAYDLYYLGRYDDALALVKKYEPVLPNDKDLPLIAGNVQVHKGDLHEAQKDFTLALDRDPKMATGYVNRGFVLNDLREPAKAAKDFKTAIQLQPSYGEAHLGLAYADLQLHRPKPALAELDAAQKALGKSHAWHLARAEGFRQEQDFPHAATEYRAALSEAPNELTTQLAYADVLYHMRRYPEAAAALDNAVKLSPSDPAIYALMAQVHAKQGGREQALRDIQSAEQLGSNRVEIFTATGDALLTLGDHNAAMQRFSRALEVPGGDRFSIRLAVAQIFLHQGHADEARRQIALGFAEARLFPDSPVTAEDLAEAANIFLAMHDFELAESYFDKAKLAGANHRAVAIGLTNTYLAEGNTSKAEAALGSLGPTNDFRDDYDYMMASANLSRQRQDPLHALSAFAQASTVAGQQDGGIAETSQYAAAEQEGRQVIDRLSIVPQASFAPALEDINVYTLDARILHVTNPALLPPPRHSFQSLAESHYRVHLGNFPAITGFVGQGMTAGRQLFPSLGIVQDRNTFDTIVNGGIAPVLRFGTNSITFNGGLQFTIRRDTISPVYMSQNLFRQFLYINTSSFFNWVSFSGSAIREAGPFTEQNLHSRDVAGNIEFTVGRPWGSTSLITGYSARDLLFRPLIEEYFNTSTYVGLQHKFGSRLIAAVLAEHLRSWRVHNTQYATAQALLPGGRFDFRATPRWSVQGSFLLSRGAGYHAYDNVQSEFLISYVRPLRGSLKDAGSEVPVAFPMRFSFGIQQQTFYDFPGSARTTVLPIVHFTLF
ncbi:MAG TPA: tetratricopeptide repeat protein [Candidatus Sulfotelmatobacter sp.]|nr:tetratricopeptide repeat protein [Candidatus Sulfotelmatobacter sp.]